MSQFLCEGLLCAWFEGDVVVSDVPVLAMHCFRFTRAILE
jgi:hypothetical protein